MTRHVLIPALIAAGVGVCAFLVGWGMILAGQAMSAQASPLPPGVQYSPPTTACTASEVPIIWYGRDACITQHGMRYVP